MGFVKSAQVMNLELGNNGVSITNASRNWNGRVFDPRPWIDLLKCSDHSSVIRAKISMSVGKKLLMTADPRNPTLCQDLFFRITRKQDFWKGTLTDKVTFNNFFWLVFYNRKGAIVDVQHYPASLVYATVYGGEVIYKIRDRYSLGYYAQVPCFNPALGGIKEPVQIFHSSEYSPAYEIFGCPDYAQADTYMDIQILLSEFHLGQINEGFFPSVIIEVPGLPEQYEYVEKNGVSTKVETDEWRDFYERFTKFYKGAKGSGKMIFVTKDNEQSIVIHKFDSSTNVDLFNNLDKISNQKILSAHRLSSPTLLGVSGSGTLSGNAGEIATATELFVNTVIIPDYQIPCITELQNMFAENNLNVTFEVLQSKPDFINSKLKS